MYFGISEDQNILLEGLGRILSDNVTIEVLRGLHERKNRGVFLKEELDHFGLFGVVSDPEYGGAGLKVVDSVLISERLGYYAAPTPYLGSIISSAAINLANKNQKGRYLSRLGTGNLRFGLAFSEHSGAKENAHIIYRKNRLSGRSLFVIDSDSDLFLIPDVDRRLFLVSSDSPGLSSREMSTIDVTRQFGEIALECVTGEEIKFDNPNRDYLTMLLAWARVIIAADTLGACQRMLDDSVAYAKQRRQFGRLIGSFQAVKHMCAEMAAKIEPCKAMVWHAACAIDSSLENGNMEANLCKAHLSEVGKYVSKTATEVHGGMGFTDLQGLHYWFKRIGVNRQLLGSPEYLRRDAARLQGLI